MCCSSWVSRTREAQSHGCIWQLPLRTASTASRIASITSWGCFLWMSCPLFVLVGTSFYRRDLVVRLHAIQPSQRAFALAVGPGSHSERELVGWIFRVIAKVDCPQPQIAILTVRVSWIIQILRNNNVPRPDCDRAFP